MPDPMPEPPAAPRAPSPPGGTLAARLRGFGPLGILAALAVAILGVLFEPFNVIPALLWARLSRTPWRELGFVRPRSWAATIALGILGGVAFKLGMKALVMPLLGADPVNPAYHFLAGNTAALPWMMIDVIVGAGFGEELVFRGFLFERSRTLLGWGRGVRIGTVLVTSLYFGALHYPSQGLAGAEQALITGLVFGTVFAATGRILPLMVAHAAFDVTAVAIIYANLETRVAHWIFR